MFNVRAEVETAINERLAPLPAEQVKLEQENTVRVLLAERFNLKVH